MRQPPALASAVDSGQQFAGELRPVDRPGRVQAGVARPATLRRVLAEVLEQDGAPAPRRLHQRAQRVQPRALARDPVPPHLAQSLTSAREVVAPPEQGGGRRIAVAARAAGFLIIALDGLRQRGVGHEAHVRLVDAHAEGDGGAHHHVLAVDERRLVGRAHRRVQPGMVGAGRSASVAGEAGRQFLGGRARGRVDDAGAGIGKRDFGQLGGQLHAWGDRVGDVRPIEAGEDQPVLRNAKLLQNVGAGGRVGGGGQRHARHVEAVEQWAQQAIVGAEVVAPLADAMRLVHGDQRQLGALEEVLEALIGGALRRDIEQVQLTIGEGAHDRRPVFVRAGERGGADADRARGGDLVVHQRDQRRDD